MRDRGEISERLAGWVHETAQACPVEMGRHAAFIRTRLVAALAVCVLAPPYLALRGGFAAPRLRAWRYAR